MGTYTHEMANQSILLGSLVETRDRCDQEIREAVTEGREMGMSWAMVALGLGTTTQAAWERFGLTPFEKAERSRLNKAAEERHDPTFELVGLDEPRKPARLRKGWTPA